MTTTFGHEVNQCSRNTEKPNWLDWNQLKTEVVTVFSRWVKVLEIKGAGANKDRQDVHTEKAESGEVGLLLY